MYTVQAEVVTVSPSITYPPSELIDSEWVDISTIPQMDSDQEELQEARKVVVTGRKYYHSIRIVQSLPDGSERIVR
jgi:hypothetical protein